MIKCVSPNNELLANIPPSQIAAKTTAPASANVWNIVGPSVITLDKSIVNNCHKEDGYPEVVRET